MLFRSGSAGEEIALEKGWKVTTLEDQAAALMEVASGTSDAAIIDLLMAGAMIGEGTSYPDLTYTDRLTEEEYGIGCRKGSDLAQYINCVLGDAYQSGTMQKLAQQYGAPIRNIKTTCAERSKRSYLASFSLETSRILPSAISCKCLPYGLLPYRLADSSSCSRVIHPFS